MKHILLIVIFTVLSISSTSANTTTTNKKERSIWSFFRFNRSETNTNEHKYVITRYGNGGIDIKCPVIQTEDGNFTIHGTYTEYYSTSNIVSRTINYKNGVCHGRQIEYYKNGLKKSETRWKNGEPHGEFKSWYKNGQLEVMGTYAKGKLDGTITYWDPDGRKTSTALYDNGKALYSIE
jgi:hypothetical protein